MDEEIIIKKPVKVEAQKCPNCGGRGVVSFGKKVCHSCNGKGILFVPQEVEIAVNPNRL